MQDHKQISDIENSQTEQPCAQLSIPSSVFGQEMQAELPIHHGTMGKYVIDISGLREQTDCFTFDLGFASTACCQSKITYIDGQKGVLMYRGYPIEELVDRSSFTEVCYLLMHGELPKKNELDSFEHDIRQHSMLHDQLQHMFRGFRRDAHPMAIMVGIVGALSAFYHDSLDINDAEQRKLASYRMIAKVPTIAAQAFRYAEGRPLVYPRNDLSFSANFLYMMFSMPTEEYLPNPVLVKAIDRILILHADHGQNASTSTVRMAGSSGANPFACVAAGVASLWGPAHGGANEAVLTMLDEIGTADRIPEFIARAKDKKDPFRLMGFGHRVYKNYDPRARVMQKTCHEVFEALGVKDDKKLKLAMELERVALADPYFIERKLYPNVDFYSGLIFTAMGIPTSMFTVLFAVARTVGWVSHWNEMIGDPQMRISRPRQLYQGYTERNYTPVDKR